MPSAQHSPAQDSNPNSSADFEWDFGDQENATPATRRLDQLVHHRFGSLDRRRRFMNASMDADAGQRSVSSSNKIIYEGSRSMDELDGPSPLTVDVIDGSSIGPRFGGRGLRKASSSSSNQSSSGYNEPELTLLPNQTYPDYPDFGCASLRERSGSTSRMETVFDIDSAVYTRLSNNLSVTSLHSSSNNKKKEKDWYETSLDSPVAGRKSKMNGTINSSSTTAVTEKPPASLPTETANTVVRAQPVRLAETGHTDDDSFEFETVVPFESPKNLELIAPGKFEPYREVSKPFETSDIYKYSAKYRQQQQTTKGLYQPLQPLACQPLNPSRNGGGGSGGSSSHPNESSENHSSHPNPPAPEFRSKPATLV